ncbi:hypothetical protein MAPG_05162 [Magnaporthiopsis poae ATCC 64411]|uniref:5-formyltetrahydrofolate cyclo-ligase n=1 Tax=Magnaporthiopsis poae (strain ATCC 64411 / 73-15) TaxID=644358 RepID=A0A0C4DYN6_MAGP6|nr:hypothetical protein MAPG_05162 [Magnaporthiopsis poae ATCC 64411]
MAVSESDADTSMSQLAITKQQLRRTIKSRLATVSRDSAKAQSQAIFNSLLTWPPYANAKRLSVFLSMPSGEVQTDAIVRHALRSGKDVFVPYLHKSSLDVLDMPARVMDMVRLRDLSDYESLAPDRWGIPSIDPASVHERESILGERPDDAPEHADRPPGLDLILMPGVAFDIDPNSGRIRRCGHGKGFYDFFLHRYAAKMSAKGRSDSCPALLCGLSLTEQFSPTLGLSVPTGPLDRHLDALILGNGEIK